MHTHTISSSHTKASCYRNESPQLYKGRLFVCLFWGVTWMLRSRADRALFAGSDVLELEVFPAPKILPNIPIADISGVSVVKLESG